MTVEDMVEGMVDSQAGIGKVGRRFGVRISGVGVDHCKTSLICYLVD